MRAWPQTLPSLLSSHRVKVPAANSSLWLRRTPLCQRYKLGAGGKEEKDDERRQAKGGIWIGSLIYGRADLLW